MPELDNDELGNDLIAIIDLFLDAGKETLTAIHQVHAAFGAPGDYGYSSKEGKALVHLYNSTRALAELVSGNANKRTEPTKEVNTK